GGPMSALEQASPPANGASVALSALPFLLRFVSTVCSFDRVCRVKLSSSGNRIDFWILVDREDLEMEDKVFVAERQMLVELDGLYAAVHIAPLTDIKEASLPPGDIVFERG